MKPKIKLWMTLVAMSVLTAPLAVPAQARSSSTEQTVEARITKVRKALEQGQLDSNVQTPQDRLLISQWSNSPGWENQPSWTNWNNWDNSAPSWNNAWANWDNT